METGRGSRAVQQTRTHHASVRLILYIVLLIELGEPMFTVSSSEQVLNKTFYFFH